MKKLDRSDKGHLIIIAVRVAVCIIGLIVALIVTSCVSFSINAEKDRASIVAVIDGEKFTKADFLDYFEAYLFFEEVRGNTIAPDASNIAYIKETAFNSYVLATALKIDLNKLEENPVTEEMVAEDVDAFWEAAHAVFEEDEDFDAAVARHAASKEDLERKMHVFLELNCYSYMTADSDAPVLQKMRDEVVFSVNGKEYHRSTLFFFVFYNSLYAEDGTDPTSIIKSSATMLAQGEVQLALAEKYGVTFTDDEIETALDEFSTIEALYETEIKSAMKSYYIDEASYQESRRLLGQILVSYDRMEDVFDKTIPTDKQLDNFYKTASIYFKYGRVSWIEVGNMNTELAAEIMEETGTTREGYFAAAEKYRNEADVIYIPLLERNAFSLDNLELALQIFAKEPGSVTLLTDSKLNSYIMYVETTVSYTPADDRERATEFYHMNLDALETWIDSEYASARSNTKEYAYTLSPEEALSDMLTGMYNIKKYPKVVTR